MMAEDYCSYELSKLLKEKGFDGMCDQYFFVDYKDEISVHTGHGNWNAEKGCISIPTTGLAMKWLREVHNIIIVIEPYYYNCMEEKTSSYDFSIWYGDNYEHPLTTNYSTYEEAVEAAILYVLSGA